MLDTLQSILSHVDAAYADLRYEIKKDVVVSFNGKELNQVSANATDGYVLRLLKHGGMSSIAFTKSDDSEKAIAIALQNALLIAKTIEQPVRLAKTPMVKATYIPHLKEDPRHITIDEKIERTRSYNSIPLAHDKIATTNIAYQEVIREKYFVNTEGSEIKEELITTKINGSIISSDGTLIQNVRVGIGGSNGFGAIRNREDEFEKQTSIALQLLKAQPVSGGEYNVILNQSMAGVFTHEAFGHFSEADLIENNPSMREKMSIGAKLGAGYVNIIDDPTLSDQLGFYKYDDEGVEAQPTQLMKDGVLVGRLHSRRTAAEFNERPNGHCVAEDFRYAPIIRMGTIFIQPANDSLEDLVAMLGDGLYILDAKGGQTSGENFTFGAQYGYRVGKGKIGNIVRDINISGNLYKTLKNIRAVGNDLKLCEVGGCGKGQLNIRSCHGAPHILINQVIIGGV